VRSLLQAVAGILFLSFFSQVHAYSVNFSCVPNMDSIDATDCTIGEAQFSVDVIDYGSSQVLFNINNSGPEQSSIRGVYFDDGTLLGISTIIDTQNGGSAGVDFMQDMSSPNMPGWDQVIPTFEATASFTSVAVNPSAHNGINEFETLGIVFDLQAGLSFFDVINDLETGALRIGLHAIDFADTGSESFVNTSPVPVPAAVWLFCSGLIGLLGLAKRRK